MISRQRLVTKLRALGYQYDSGSARAHVYRKPGSSKLITVNLRDLYSETLVGTLLRSCGVADDDIKKWMKEESEAKPETK
jgi:hypothetical protein